ncbi:hypothetical protein A2526_02390 [candidate division WOR-1 bacterium RIFOXYD2_FULL_36_8]|uniref:Uncharacterized protein n=1 Tax=candidate division WOR-1 bacterium RIFOXYB2_FULL_36_35 TaxID=1802578 RepID=A0A1F4S3J8_UNCSA|nr:MAG: hypothetical protein A2230_08990 [candidate division WOR-1 bacterium RIFOXYA2_FULL_36_21]OGC15008.1 MAG: hypothetical protein A2290_01630 [candidate division WOR-1 bacterium RIFOXYB2_FULL_36_35]OGC18715.1 MAG: hypothetical protein A2282_07410 [candidate division WOR-1 bacterium RIFOXYA12_FULL_36_13]OGC39245.1 MAG: hypothetical protein A2526_02390 [candidate division WOR-1 bacterium RIFOXYD2_FULL_36_8]
MLFKKIISFNIEKTEERLTAKSLDPLIEKLKNVDSSSEAISEFISLMKKTGFPFTISHIKSGIMSGALMRFLQTLSTSLKEKDKKTIIPLIQTSKIVEDETGLSTNQAREIGRQIVNRVTQIVRSGENLSPFTISLIFIPTLEALSMVRNSLPEPFKIIEMTTDSGRCRLTVKPNY